MRGLFCYNRVKIDQFFFLERSDEEIASFLVVGINKNKIKQKTKFLKIL